MWLINVCWANREEALFEKFKVAAESYSTLSTITGVETKLRCSGHCVVNVECTGFRFNEFNGECRMIGCMNPVYDLTGDNGEEVYFQRPTALLARGIVNRTLIFVHDTVKHRSLLRMFKKRILFILGCFED